MPATADELAAIRAWVGAAPDDATLQVQWTRQPDAYSVALDVLRGRLADLITTTDLDVDGFVREGSPNAEQIKALRAMISTLEGLVPGPDPDDPDADSGLVSGVLVRGDQGVRLSDGAHKRRSYAR